MTVKEIRDVSHHDYDRGDTDVSMTPMLCAKWTQGNHFEDPSHDYWLSKGLPTAAYHWVEDAALSSIDSQVKYAITKIGKTRPTMADIEVLDVNGQQSWPSFDEALAWCRGFQAAGGDLRSVYIPHWFWQGNWGSPSLKPFADLGVFLISSSYTTYSDTGVGWQPYGGMTPAMWQYTSTPHDKNAFKGTVSELLTLWGFQEDDMTPAEYLAILQDPAVTKYLRAAAWQYDGRGISAGTTLAALDGAYHAARSDDVTAQMAALSAKVDGLIAAVTALAQSGTSIDTSAILTKIDQVAAQESATVQALQAKLAAAAQAEAAAFNGGSPATT